MEITSKQIIVMRIDLRNAQGQKIRTGKMCAQAAHASLKAILDLARISPLNHIKCEECDLALSDGECQCGRTYNEIGEKLTIELKKDSAIKDWLTGRFTKVCVAVNSEDELLEVYNKAKEKGLICSLIKDAGLTEFNNVPTLTCCAIGPVWSNELEGITDHLKLL